jgi:hypothetical protein
LSCTKKDEKPEKPLKPREKKISKGHLVITLWEKMSKY